MYISEKFLRLVLVFTLPLLVSGCTKLHDNDDSKNASGLQKQRADSLHDKLMYDGVMEADFLLANKYEVEKSTVTDIIDEYLAIYHDDDYLVRKILLGIKPDSLFLPKDENISKTIYRLSVKHNISQPKVAGIIFDYRLFTKASNDDDDDE